MLSADAAEAAFRTGPVAAIAHRDVIVLDGPDAVSYLHGQISQNVERLAVGDAAWTLLLEPNGRVTAWGRITRTGDATIVFDVDPGAGADTLARLERFKLRTDATFTLHENVPTLSVRAADGADVDDVRAQLTDAAAGVAAVALTAVVVAALPWPGVAGFDLIGLADTALLGDVAVELAAPEVLELERIESGRPAMGREFVEKTIPAETGVVERSADFTKGCYVGQELVARVDSRGNNTPRSVHPGRAAVDAEIAAGDELVLDGDVVGTITSVATATAHTALLASIKRGVEVPATVSSASGAAIDIAAPHWE